MILPTIEVYLGCTNADKNIDAVTMIFCGLIAMAKMIWFRIYADNLIKTYKFAVNDYLMVQDAGQRAIMLRHAFVGKTLMCFIVSLTYIDAVVYTLTPFLGSIIKHQNNATQEVVELEYALPSRCALQYLNAPQNMYATYCTVELIMMLLVCTSNYGSTYFSHGTLSSHYIAISTN